METSMRKLCRIATIFLVFHISLYVFAVEKPMKNILIVYGSFSGSTKGIAEKMKNSLESIKFKVELVPAAVRTMDLSKYDLVVIGSAIRAGKPHPDVLKFIEKNQEALKKKKTAVFIVCMSIISEKPENRARAEYYPEKVAIGFTPVSTAIFAGVVQDNWLQKLTLGKPGDYRDWKKI